MSEDYSEIEHPIECRSSLEWEERDIFCVLLESCLVEVLTRAWLETYS